MDPHAEYKRRHKARRAMTARLKRLDRRLGQARLGLAVLGVVTGWLVFAQHLVPFWTLLFPIAGFLVLVVVHERLGLKRRRAKRAAEFYQRGIERLEGRWRGRGTSGDRLLKDEHPYAGDLDVFGRGSLFELLSTGRTLAGQRTLAHWLLHPASPQEIRARQAAVSELRDRLDLREDLAVMGEDVRRGIHAGALPKWGEAPPILDSPTARVVAAVLCVIVFTTFAGMMMTVVPPTVFLVALSAAGVFGYVYRMRVLRVISAIEQPAHDIGILSEVLARLEAESFTSGRLVELQARLQTNGQPPSKRIARLNRLVELLDSRDHLLMRVAGPPLLWSTQLTFAIEAWRKETGPELRGWLMAVGEFEALSSLASFSFEHPEDPFPEIVEGEVRFEGRGLGHPLLPESVCVRNDVTLDLGQQVLLISGSNMSGKSTLLRTVGTNAILAMAGAPVRAESLRLSHLNVGASIRVTDSLESGVSRFYAEITRIRQLMDMTGEESTLLFLLDELLHGTNSHDRRIGAEAIVRRLVEKTAIGMVTTHDLAIAHIEEDLSPRVANVHLQDHLEDGEMRFDYKLRPGVVEHSNAIELMRSIGLEV